MSSKRNILEAMDSCRSGSDDLNRPEMRELAELLTTDPEIQQQMARLARFDDPVGRAMHDVPVDPMLAQRLLAAVQVNATPADTETAQMPSTSDLAADPKASDSETPDSETPDSTSLPAAAVPANTRQNQVANRRRSIRWLAVAASLFFCLGLTWAAVWWRSIPYTADELASQAQRWVAAVEPADWQQDVPHQAYQQIHQMLGLNRYATQWRQFNASPLDRNATMYDLSRPGQPRAALLVISTPHQFVDAPSFPREPRSMTRQYLVGICQREGLVYLLVVEGSPRRYRQFFKQPRIG